MLLEVTDLRVTLHTARGPADALRGVSFSMQRGDTARADRRIGLRQEHHRAGADGPAARRRARSRGSIRFDGQELTTLDEAALCALRGDRIGMVFQEPMTALNPLHTIGRQIAEPLRLHQGLSARARRAPRRCACCERVQLPQAAQRLDAYPHQLSGGQRQRVVIAIALACGPDLLIADEPTTALDVTIQREVLDLIAELVRRGRHGPAADQPRPGRDGRDRAAHAGDVRRHGGRERAHGRRLPRAWRTPTRAACSRRGRGWALARGTRLATIPGRVPELADLPAGCPFAERCALVRRRLPRARCRPR